MNIKDVVCPHCGAPLPPYLRKSVVCEYCGRVLVGLPRTWWARPVAVPSWRGRAADAGRTRIRLGPHRWVLTDLIERAERTFVYRAHRDSRLSVAAILHIARRPGDDDVVRREADFLLRLHRSTTDGAEHFKQTVPFPLAKGRVGGDDRFAAAFLYPPGFGRSLAAVDRVEPPVAVWLLKRQLELLTWLHRSGFCHRRLVAENVLPHRRDHGVVVVGWSKARRGASAPERRADVKAAVRLVEQKVEGGGRRFKRFFSRAAESPDAWAVHQQLTALSGQLFGAPRHHPLLPAPTSVGLQP